MSAREALYRVPAPVVEWSHGAHPIEIFCALVCALVRPLLDAFWAENLGWVASRGRHMGVVGSCGQHTYSVYTEPFWTKFHDDSISSCTSPCKRLQEPLHENSGTLTHMMEMPLA